LFTFPIVLFIISYLPTIEDTTSFVNNKKKTNRYIFFFFLFYR
jgi:hypothetical protein